MAKRAINGLERDFGNFGEDYFGDDGSGLDLGSLTSGLGDASSAASSAVSDATSTISSAASTVQSAASGVVSQAQGIVSDATSEVQGLAGQAQGYASQATNALSGAASQAQGALSNISNQASSALGQASGAVNNLLATVDGVMVAANGIGSSLTSGDYLAAGQQALSVVQKAASDMHSTSTTAAAGAAMSAKMSAAGAAIGTVIPVIGNVVGAVIGAIVGFVVGVADSLSGNLVTDKAVLGLYNSMQLTYIFLKDPSLLGQDAIKTLISTGSGASASDINSAVKNRVSTWFSKTPMKSDDVLKGAQNSNFYSHGLPFIFGFKGDPSGMPPANKAVPASTWNSITRDAFWKNWFTAYRDLQGSGATASKFNFTMFGAKGTQEDYQPVLDLFMNGGTPFGDSPGNKSAPMAGFDFATWVAAQPDGMKQLLASPTELQASIMPLLPMAMASIVYMPYVQILSAPNTYSPLAVDAVRQAALKQAQASGPQVAQVVALSVPNDDIQLLLHAYSFLNISESEYPPQSTMSGGAKLSAGQVMWSPSGLFRLSMQSDGNLVLYQGSDDSIPLWASNTAGSGATFVTMQGDGNLVVYNGSHPVWASNTTGNKSAIATLQDDGNFVVYDTIAGKKALWSANVSKPFSTYPMLSYMVERKGIWGSVDDGTQTVKALQRTIGEALMASGIKSTKDATALLNKWNNQDHLELSQKKLNALASVGESVSNKWSKTWPGDPYKGDSTALIDSKIGLGPAVPGKKGHVKGRTQPAKTAKPKSNLTNHHWWIEAVVMSLVGIVTYNVVYSGKKKPAHHPV